MKKLTEHLVYIIGGIVCIFGIIILIWDVKPGTFNCTTPKESARFSIYEGGVIMGKQLDTESCSNGAEFVTFKKGDSVWTESYMRCVWGKFKAGDTIK